MAIKLPFSKMVLTHGQHAGDPSSAKTDRFPISTGNPVVALTYNNAYGITITASGDALNSGRKPHGRSIPHGNGEP